MADISTIKLVVDASTANVTINQVHTSIGSLNDDLGKVKLSLDSLMAPLTAITGLFAGWGVLHIAESLADTADEYTNVGNRIRQTVTNQTDYNTAMANVLSIANDTRTSLESTAELYQKVGRGVQGLGGSVQDTATVTRALSETMITSGASGNQLYGAMRELSDMFNSGQLKGQQFLALMRDAPQVLDVLARSLNVPVSSLHEMANNGQLTTQALVNAFKAAAPQIQAAFDALPMTFSGALQTLKNDWETFVGKFSQDSGLGAYAQAFIQSIASMVMGVGNDTLAYSKSIGQQIIGIFQTTLMTAASIIDSISALTQKAGNFQDNVSKSNAATPVDLLLKAFGTSTADVQKFLHIPQGGLISLLAAGPDGDANKQVTTAQDAVKKLLDDTQQKYNKMMASLNGTNPLAFGGANIPKVVPQIDQATFNKYQSELISLTKQFDPLTSKTQEYNKVQEELNKMLAAGPLLWDKLGTSQAELNKLKQESTAYWQREMDVIGQALVPYNNQIAAMQVDKNVRTSYLATLNMETQLKNQNITVTKEQINQYTATIQKLQELQKTDTFKESMKDTNEALQQQLNTYGLIGDQLNKANELAKLQWDVQKNGIKDVQPLIDQYAADWDTVHQKMLSLSTATLGIQQSLYSFVQNAKDVAAGAKSAMDTVLSSLTDSMANLFATGKFGLTNFLQTVTLALDKLASQQIISILAQAFGFGNTVVTGHAGGGSVNAGQPYWVGENGPELFYPSQGGSIVPNYQSNQLVNSGGTGNVSVGDIHLSLALPNISGQMTNDQVTQMASAITTHVKLSMLNELRTNGFFN